MQNTLKNKKRYSEFSRYSDDNLLYDIDDLKPIDRKLKRIETIGDRRKYKTGYGHSKLIAGLALLLMEKKYFRKFDRLGRPVTKHTIAQFLKARYKMPFTQRLYRDPDVCLKYAIAIFPNLMECESSKRPDLVKLSKLIN